MDDYLYQSGDYVCDFTRKLNAQRTTGLFCDVILVADAVEFPAHRCVLAATTDYFAIMFNIDMTESTQSRIHVGGATADALGRLLDFVYSGTLCITKDSVVNLVFLSSMLMMFDVADACWQHFVGTLDVENCIERKMLADSAATSQGISNGVTAFVLENFKDLNKNTFASCPVEFISDLFTREDLPVANELDVLQVFLKWCTNDLGEKEKLAEELLDSVRFAFLTVDQDALEKLLGSYGITSESLVYSSILERAITRSGLHQPRLSYKNERVVVVVGGQDQCSMLNKMSAYLPSCGTWFELSEMNYSRKRHFKGELYPKIKFALFERTLKITDFGLITIKNDLFVIGGTMEKVLNRATPFVERYNASKDTWEEVHVTSVSELERDNAGVVGFRGNMILAGGFEMSSGVVVSSVVELDPSNGNWKALASLNVAREAHVVVANDNSMYVIGGKNQTGILDSLERYDVESETWVVLKSMNTKRRHACAVWSDGKLYVFGGHDGVNVLKSVEVYEPGVDRWQLLTDMLTPRMKFGVSVFDGHAYVIGGMKGSRGPMVSDVEKFNFKDSTWSSVCPMGEGKMEMNCATVTVPFKFLK